MILLYIYICPHCLQNFDFPKQHINPPTIKTILGIIFATSFSSKLYMLLNLIYLDIFLQMFKLKINMHYLQLSQQKLLTIMMYRQPGLRLGQGFPQIGTNNSSFLVIVQTFYHEENVHSDFVNTYYLYYIFSFLNDTILLI